MFYKTMAKKTFGAIVAASMLIGSAGTMDIFADNSEYDNVFTFSDSAIDVSGSGSSYKINGTALTINYSGTYMVTGDCSEGSIQVKKGTTGVTLVLSDLSLTSTTTAPLSLNKTTETTVVIEGNNTLTDNEYDETSEDYEGAAIKSKSGSTTTLTGTGTLTVDGSSCNNGIKGASETKVIIGSSTTDSFTINISAANNGLASDGSVVINGGNLNIEADNDAIKSSPDDDDSTSEGSITINGGSGTIKAGSDGVQASSDITVTGGDFDITTGSGYDDKTFDSDTMSCKGLKASASSDDSSDSTDETTETTDETEETTDESEASNLITITGGSLTFNTADDAIHSDGDIVIKGGDFDIKTGDDAAHADNTLTMGEENAADCAIHFNVESCYEGLEGCNVYVYSGCYNITASDDGINAADGSDSDDQPFGPGGNNGGPGQQGNQGNPGGQGGFGGPGGNQGNSNNGSGNQGGFNGPDNQGGNNSSNTDKFSINIYGGLININADGDGIDSNGNLNMTGGTTIVWGGSGPENPLDYDGNFYINGATVFAAGYNEMAVSNPISGSQNYTTFTSSISQGKTVNVKYNNSSVFSTKALKNGSYLFYSTPEMTSSSGYSLSFDNSEVNDTNWTEHTWNSGEVTKEATTTEQGVITYTCTECGATYFERTPLAENSSEADSSSETDSSSIANSSSESGSSSETDSSSIADSSSESGSSSVSDSSTDDSIIYANVKYQLKNNNDTVRFIYIADEEVVAKSNSGEINVNVTNSDGGTLIETSVSVKSVYTQLYAGGSLITAPSGKVFIISPEANGMTTDSIYAQAVFTLSSISEKYAGKYSNS